MGRVEQARQIDDIFSGKLSVPDAHTDVQAWFELTLYNLAIGLADTPKEERKEKVEYMKKHNSEWCDDVLPLARELIKQGAHAPIGE